MTTLSGQIVDLHRETITRATNGETAYRSLNLGSLVPDSYDYISLTYVAAGVGAGEIEEVTYRSGGVAGDIVAVLTLGYDVSNRLQTITKT